MRAKRNILSIVIAVMCVLSITAQESNLNDSLYKSSQEQTIAYTKGILQELGGKILLPKEVNTILNHNESEKIYAVPQWDSLYFEQNSKYITSLVLPLKVKTTSRDFEINLNIIKDQLRLIYNRIVLSNFTLQNDSITEYITICSNIFGEFSGSQVYYKNMVLKEYVPIKKLKIVDAIYKTDSKASTNGNSNTKKSKYSILKNNDWRRANNKGYHRDEQGNIRLHKWH